MASSPTQVTTSAIDQVGLSVSTSSPVTGAPGLGALYDRSQVAAAAPVWFMPVGAAPSHSQSAVAGVTVNPLIQNPSTHNVPSFLMLNAMRVHSGTTSPADPGAYLSYSTDTAPSWLMINPTTGHRVLGGGASLPLQLPTSKLGDANLRAASSGHQMLWTLGSGSGGALLRSFHTSSWGGMNLVNEEIIAPVLNAPDGDTVNFDAGVNRIGGYLSVYGTDAAGLIYVIRKPWSTVGVNGVSTVLSGSPNPSTFDSRWEYQTLESGASAASWSRPDAAVVSHALPSSLDAPIPGIPTVGRTTSAPPPLVLSPLKDTYGRPVISTSPVSFAVVRSQQIMTTTDADGTLRTWTKRAGGPWSPGSLSVTVPAGHRVLDGLRLHPLVPVSPGSSATHPVAATYLTQSTSPGGHTFFNLNWVLVQLKMPS